MAKRVFIVLALLLVCSGCKHMGPAEYGVRFRRLPPSFGGGLSKNVVPPGKMVVLWPWDTVYTFDTTMKSMEWGAKGEGTDIDHEDYVHTRALDGNEVALAVKIQYYVSREPEKLITLAKKIATSEEEVAQIVSSVARADIRTQMNYLRTSEFSVNDAKYRGEQQIKEAMTKRLAPFGIVIDSVNLKEHRFERLLPDGTLDHSYQEKINEVQTYDEQTKKEALRKETVENDKQAEYNKTEGDVNQIIAQADGYKDQSKLRGDGYFQAKSNEAQAILAAGTAEVEGITQQINALNGPGGEAILKLELGRQLLKNNPHFIVLGKGSGTSGIDVNKTDTNELLRQVGAFEALSEQAAKEQKTSAPVVEDTKQ